MFSLFEYWNSAKSHFDARSLKRDIQMSLGGIATDNQELIDPKVIYENFHLQRKSLKIDINEAAGDGVGVRIYRETVRTRKLPSEGLPSSVSPLAEIIRLKIDNSNEILRRWRPNATNYWSYYIPEKTPRRSIVSLYLNSSKFDIISSIGLTVPLLGCNGVYDLIRYGDRWLERDGLLIFDLLQPAKRSFDIEFPFSANASVASGSDSLVLRCRHDLENLVQVTTISGTAASNIEAIDELRCHLFNQDDILRFASQLCFQPVAVKSIYNDIEKFGSVRLPQVTILVLKKFGND